MSQIRLCLARHGAVAGEAALYGRTDVALSELGWQQMQLLQQQLEAHPPQLVVSSALKRCVLPAAKMAKHWQVEHLICADWHEMDFGYWDGVPFAPDSEFWPAQCAFWQDSDNHSPPNGESLAQFNQRVQQGFAKYWPQLQRYPNQLWLLHGGVIRVLLQLLVHQRSLQHADYANYALAYGSVVWLRQQAPNVAEFTLE